MTNNFDKAAIDESILAVFEQRGMLPTYVVKNWLRQRWKGIKTSQVLSGCRRLEKAGRVKIVPRYSCVNSISWEITAEGKKACQTLGAEHGK